MTGSQSESTPLVRLVLFMICLAVAGSVLAGAYYLAAGFSAQKPVQVPTNSATGGIQVWATPGNAYVEVSPTDGGMGYGGWTNSAGSYTLTTIPAYMTYRITVTRDGYLPYSTTLYVEPNIIAETHPVLQADIPATGTIDITVSPYGGTVCVDGGQCESYSMDSNGELSRQVRDLAGNQWHTVTVAMDGYYPFSQDVWVPAGDTAPLRVTMQRR